jgi:Tol biopolymer transport system component/DNA-binding winged helix-turn-helix (wHTH) protein
LNRNPRKFLGKSSKVLKSSKISLFRCGFMACYSFGAFVLDPAARVLCRDNRQLEITAKVFETLLFLVQNHGRVVEKDELLAVLWPHTTVEEANLTQSVSTLRKVLDDTPKQHRYIATIPGRGYSFVASVVESPDSKLSELEEKRSQLVGELESKARWRGIRSNYYWSGAALSFIFLIGSVAYVRRQHVSPGPVYYSAVPLTSYLGLEICPSFSPNGDKVAFAWDGVGRDNFDIYVKQLTTGPPLRLTDAPEPDISPAWSPDGRTVAFLHVLGDNTAELSLIPATGPGPRRILATIAMESEYYFPLRFISWSPDGKWLAVSDAPTPAGVSSLYLLSTETGEKRRATLPPAGYDDFEPDFSPDMRSLAFARCTSVGASASDLYVVRLSGDLRPVGEPRRLTASNRQSSSPVWTPNGRAILFARREGGGSHSLWRINVTDPGQIEPLPIPADNSSALALSRRGDKIVYTRDIEDGNIWAVDVSSAGSNRADRVRPSITSTSIDANPQFSPDGKYVAYQSGRSGKLEIWISERDGANAHQLTDLGAIVSGFPRWSPNGEKIVFHSRPSGSASLYVVDAAGGTPKQLTGGEGNDISPSWSRDGKWIYFGSRRSGEPHIWKVPAGGGPAIQLTKHSGYCPLESKDGQYLYFASQPDCSLWRLPLAGGPETKVLSGMAGEGTSYAPAKNGVYFIRAVLRSRKQELAFFRFATGQSETVTPIPGRASLGLALSPDERSILYGQTDHRNSDLMLVEQFR